MGPEGFKVAKAERAQTTEEQREWSPEEIKEFVFAQLRKSLTAQFANMPYHNPDHSFEQVFNESGEILDTAEKAGYEITDAERLAAQFASAGHDRFIRTTLDMTPGSFTYGSFVRIRGATGEGLNPETGQMETIEKMPMPPATEAFLENERWKVGNEEGSWLILEHLMDEADPDGKVFTPEVRDLAKKSIIATFPENTFPAVYPSPEDVHIEDRDPETGESRGTVDISESLAKSEEGKPAGLKFDQPFLTPDSPITVLAVALADLSEGGRLEASEFRKKGNAEYWETKKLIRDQLTNDFADLSLPEEKNKAMAAAASSMLGWASSQPGFLLWQKIRFNQNLEQNKEIQAHPEFATTFKADMHQLYSHFDDNILDAHYHLQDLKQRYQDLTKAETFASNPQAAEQLRELARMMDYEQFFPPLTPATLAETG